MESKFTCLSWNISGRTLPNLLPGYASLLASAFFNGNRPGIDIIALQEVKRPVFEYLAGAYEKGRKLFAKSFFSLDQKEVTGDRGCAIFVSDRFKVTLNGPLSFPDDEECGIRFAGSTYVVELTSPDTGPLTAGSFHIPNGSNHGFGKDRYGKDKGDFKRRFGHRLAEWLNERTMPTIFGVDANSPEVDHIDPDRVGLFSRSDSECLFGKNRIHQARDAWRDYRTAHPQEPQRFSFKGTRKTPVRFDHIWLLGKIHVGEVRYGLLEVSPEPSSRMLWLLDSDRANCLSDHAWVAAELLL